MAWCHSVFRLFPTLVGCGVTTAPPPPLLSTFSRLYCVDWMRLCLFLFLSFPKETLASVCSRMPLYHQPPSFFVAVVHNTALLARDTNGETLVEQAVDGSNRVQTAHYEMRWIRLPCPMLSPPTNVPNIACLDSRPVCPSLPPFPPPANNSFCVHRRLEALALNLS